MNMYNILETVDEFILTSRDLDEASAMDCFVVDFLQARNIDLESLSDFEIQALQQQIIDCFVEKGWA